LAIQREQDLAVSATGFFLGKPYPSNDEFLAWANAVHALETHILSPLRSMSQPGRPR
jgi:hypothetical protein